MPAVKRCLACLLCLLILVCAFSCDRGNKEVISGNNISEYSSIILLTNQQKNDLLQAARTGLQTSGKLKFDPLIEAMSCGGVCMEIHAPGVKPIIKITGNGRLGNAISATIKHVAADANFKAYIKNRLDEARIKINIIDSISRVDFDRSARSRKIFRQISRNTEDGFHGFIISCNGKTQYQLPDEVIYKGWGLDIREKNQGKKRIRGRRLVTRQIETLSEKTCGDKRAWKNGELYKFTTQSFIDDPAHKGVALDCCRAHTLIPPLSAESLRKATSANIDYLLRILKDDGTLAYHYYPNEDEYDPEYYLPHHAGYVLRMLEAYNTLGDERLLHAAQKALAFLMDKTVFPANDRDIAIIETGDKSEIGLNALMAMIHAVIPEKIATAKTKEYGRRFAEAVLRFRMPEAGLFYATYNQTLQKRPPDKQVPYFPGVAMLALARWYEKTGDEKWRTAAAEISEGQEKLWSEGGDESVGRFCWVAMAWARMARIEKDPEKVNEYKRLGYKHADAVILHQYSPDRAPYFNDYRGAADNSRPPRTTPTSARAESLAENYLTAKYFGDVERQKKYGAALMRALHFVVENQFTIDNTWYLPNPGKAIGGIRGGLTANDIRVDYNQHTLGAMLNALSVPEDLEKLGAAKR